MFIFVVKPLGTCRGWGSSRSVALLSAPPEAQCAAPGGPHPVLRGPAAFQTPSIDSRLDRKPIETVAPDRIFTLVELNRPLFTTSAASGPAGSNRREGIIWRRLLSFQGRAFERDEGVALTLLHFREICSDHIPTSQAPSTGSSQRGTALMSPTAEPFKPPQPIRSATSHPPCGDRAGHEGPLLQGLFRDSDHGPCPLLIGLPWVLQIKSRCPFGKRIMVQQDSDKWNVGNDQGSCFSLSLRNGGRLIRAEINSSLDHDRFGEEASRVSEQ
ncbi:unnamed protein product [Pleuronectes platessa]|uniref:Uncharacterized protein n=1 Tax=Pleuronectes platessa TaxID=8262 RepID=A0A9N7ZET5_PLEPL|nr:unnamed protein product [Pleuronectes platessa]